MTNLKRSKYKRLRARNGRFKSPARRSQTRDGQYKFSGRDFKSQAFFGGSLSTTRAHRTARPISTKDPIHLILRSSKAFGARSFWRKENARFIERALKKYSKKWGVTVMDCGNVGNHLHVLIKLSNRFTYAKFIKSLTGAISLHLTRWNKNRGENPEKFWDFRPYTRIVKTWSARLTMKDYISINRLEGLGCDRVSARMIWGNLKAEGTS